MACSADTRTSHVNKIEMTNLQQNKISFYIAGFWRHVIMSGNIGTDQHGERWIKRDNRLYSEFSYYVIDLNSKEVLS
jgi:hypothetical protein